MSGLLSGRVIGRLRYGLFQAPPTGSTRRYRSSIPPSRLWPGRRRGSGGFIQPWRVVVLHALAARHSNGRALVPAVGYLRRSTEKQEQSLVDQRREIKRYAGDHGYQIVRWYEDDGICGDATEKRLGFLSMQRAAANGRDFDVVLCWDQDRFGRFDSLEAGHWIHPFRKAGVRLETVTEGKINWNDFTGRVMYGLKQEGKHQFLIDLSRNTARGQISNAQKGHLCGQAAPYGYDRILVDEAGQPKQRVRNGEKFAKPRSWHVSLVPSDDPEKVQTLRWLFEQYATTDIGIRSLVDDLNRRCVPSPRGGQWYMGTVRMILRNEAYVGTFVWAKRRLGKYHRVAAGEVKARDDGAQVGMNPREEHIVVPGAHPALIAPETFVAVQDRLTERKHQPSSHKRTNGDRYLLSGVVFCGHCGQKMHGSIKTRRKGGKVYTWETYVCSTYVMKGRSCGCGYHTVDQGELLTYVLKAVRALCFADGNREALTDDVREQIAQGQTVDPAEVVGLRAKVADLDKDLEHGTRRLLRAPDDVADLLAGELSALRRERDRLATQLAVLERPAASEDVPAEAERIVEHLWRYADELQAQIPAARLREIIRNRIDLYFDHVPRGTRIECPFSKGTLHFRQDENMFFLENRGDWI